MVQQQGMPTMKNMLKTTALVALIATPAFADKSNDTLRVAFTKELENVDSFFNSSREGVVLQRAVISGFYGVIHIFLGISVFWKNWQI